MTMILRAINIADEIRGVHSDDRVREFVISNERRDSHGTVIRMSGWDIEDYNRAGAFYYQHLTGGFDDPNPDNALGPGSARIEDGVLIGRAMFETADINPLADKIMKKVDYGTLSSTSVGFVPIAGHWGRSKDMEDEETYYFDKQVLKEFSIVHIPSNPDAVKKSMEAFDWYMERQAQDHKSEGFRKDFRSRINRQRMEREYLLNLAKSRNLI